MENKKKSALEKFIDFIDFRKQSPTQEVITKLDETHNISKEELVKEDNLKTQVTAPAGRVSKNEYDNNIFNFSNEYVRPDFRLEYIPKLRTLSKSNENVGSVYNDLIQLTNTGHQIKFDQNISPDLADRMKKHLESKRDSWGSGVHGIDGLINKWIGQVWISGALSNEWVPQRDLRGVQNSVLVNPENILFKYNGTTTFYEPYQRVKNMIGMTNGIDNTIKLNTETYFYAGILGDTDAPYGIPPFITALEALSTQKNMKKNINFILKQMGLLGYLEVLLDKPAQEAGESEKAYMLRLNKLLETSKKNVTEGFMDGIVTGYRDDHEFNFHSTTKQLAGVSELYNQNEVGMANGLKTSASFLGQKSGGTETNMGIVFTKMLSQLKNVQMILSFNLKKGYLLELRLAGFNIKSSDIKVEFKPSTITDDLKLWQTREIKQRTTKALLIDGVIGFDTYAEENGYNKPFGKPLIPIKEQQGTGAKGAGEKKSDRNEVKKKSDRKGRDKVKDQPRRKDGDTKTR